MTSGTYCHSSSMPTVLINSQSITSYWCSTMILRIDGTVISNTKKTPQSFHRVGTRCRKKPVYYITQLRRQVARQTE